MRSAADPVLRRTRRRLIIWNCTVVALLVLLFGTALYGSLTYWIGHRTDTQLSTTTRRIERVVRRLGPHLRGEPPGIVFLFNGQGRLLLAGPFSRVSPDLPDLDAVQQVLVTRQPDLRTIQDARLRDIRVQTQAFLTASGATYVVQVGQQLNGLEDIEQTFLQVQAVLGVIGFLAAALSGIFLAGRAVAPIAGAYQEQRRFVADASHELRTPLALIRANAEVLDRGWHTHRDTDRSLLQDITAEVDRLDRLVEDLLTLARRDAGRLDLAREPVAIADLLAAATRIGRTLCERFGLTFRLDEQDDGMLLGDRDRLVEVVGILLDNAARYTPKGGVVTCGARVDQSTMRLCITDTGIGIAHDDLPHVFQRFYRADRARRHATAGAGLGLAIAQEIALAHGGSITLSSEPGVGTRACLIIPLQVTERRRDATWRRVAGGTIRPNPPPHGGQGRG